MILLLQIEFPSNGLLHLPTNPIIPPPPPPYYFAQCLGHFHVSVLGLELLTA